MEFDVIIIGASYTGMSSAISIGNLNKNLNIAVIEKNDFLQKSKISDGKCFAISSSSLSFFDTIGIKERILQHSGIIKDIKITDNESLFDLDFISDKKVLDNKLGTVCDSKIIYDLLKDRLQSISNIKIFSPNSYKEINFVNETCEIILDNDLTLKSKIVISAEGKFSGLREKFQIDSYTKDYNQEAIVFSIKHDSEHKNIAHEKFFATGPVAILPLKDKNESSIIWILKKDLAKEMQKLELDEFKYFLGKYIAEIVGKFDISSNKFSYPLKLSKSSRYYYKNIIFIGDSACAIHPIAGQGFNLSISTIKILVKLLEENMQKYNILYSNNLFESYEKNAKIVTHKMVYATDFLNDFFENDDPIISIIRKIGLAGIDKIDILKKFFIKSAGGIY